MQTCFAHYYKMRTNPTLIRPGQVHLATTTRYFVKNTGTKQGLNDKTFQGMCLGPAMSLRHIPRALLSGYGAVRVLQAKSLRSWKDGGKHYCRNLRCPVCSPQGQELLLWNKQAQGEAASSHELLQDLRDEATFPNRILKVGSLKRDEPGPWKSWVRSSQMMASTVYLLPVNSHDA